MTNTPKHSITVRPSVEADRQAPEQTLRRDRNSNLTKSIHGRADAKTAFGLSLHSPIALAGTGRLGSTNYAWSAHSAHFAWVATEAKYALHITPGNGGTTTQRTRSPPSAYQTEKERMELKTCAGIFRRLEQESVSVGGQDADVATYAGLSDYAEYAVYADSAVYIL